MFKAKQNKMFKAMSSFKCEADEASRSKKVKLNLKSLHGGVRYMVDNVKNYKTHKSITTSGSGGVSFHQPIIIHSKSEPHGGRGAAEKFELFANLSKYATEWPKNGQKLPKMALE